MHYSCHKESSAIPSVLALPRFLQVPRPLRQRFVHVQMVAEAATPVQELMMTLAILHKSSLTAD